METAKILVKVIGIGDCGCNVIEYMFNEGIQGVEFIAVNTDTEALRKINATKKLILQPANGIELDLNIDPEVGRAAAENSHGQIKEMLSGADMIFLVAGMGSATATGAASVIAQIARDLKILCIAIVTRPVEQKGIRINFSREGIKLCHFYADTLLVLPNPISVIDKTVVTGPDAFKLTSQAVCQFVTDMVGLINNPGLISIDLSDIRAMLSGSGMAKSGSAVASGHDRAKIAAELAKGNADISSAKAVLINVISDGSLKLRELDSLMDCIMLSYDHPQAILGATFDESMGDELRITIMATGLNLSRHLYLADSK